MLRLNPAGMYAVGVHLDPAVTTFVVLDLLGAVVRHSSIKTPASSDPGPSSPPSPLKSTS